MRSLSWWVSVAWALSFALLILNALVALHNVVALRRADAQVSLMEECRAGLGRLLADVTDAESSTRGFVVTGREEFLDAFRAAEPRVDPGLERIRGSAAGDPELESGFATVEALVRDKFHVMREMIRVRREPGGEVRAREMVVTGQGRAPMDALRAAIGDVDGAAAVRLADRLREEEAGYRSTEFATVLGSSLTVAMAAMAFALARRELAARKKAEAGLRRTAATLAGSQRQTADTLALLDTFLGHAPIGIAFFDPDLRYVRVNELLASGNGRPVDEHLGRRLTDVLPDVPAAVVSDLRQVLANGRPILNRPVTGRGPDRDRTWLSSYYPVRTDDGRALGVGVVTQDVTERLAAENRLRDSEARYRAVFDTAADGIITIDDAGVIESFNPAAERLFGYRAAEVAGKNVSMLMPDPYRSDHDDYIAGYLRTGQAKVIGIGREVVGRRKDGTTFPIDLAVSETVVGGRRAFTGIVRDITERKRAEETLRESEARYRTLAEAIPQMVWNADATGRVTYFNRRWVEYTGLSAADAVESWWTQVAHPDDAARLEAAWRRAVSERPEPFDQEVRVRDADDGTYKWFLTAVVPLRSADGSVDQWIGSLSSIDEQKRQSEILAALVKMRTAELESANHLLREEIAERTRAEGRAHAAAVELGRSNEELEKFAYVASHDLQEPLRKIQAFGDRLVKKYRDALGPDGQEYVDRMKGSAARMRTLIEDLLKFSRVATKGQAFAKVDLGTVVADVLSDLEERVAQTGGRVDVGGLPTIEADSFQMRQLFQNLIGNSLKFHKPGAAPTVTIRSVPWTDLVAGGGSSPPGEGYRITVADDGIGFDPAYSERVFELFQRLHGRGDYEGTGIGLAICRKIVQRHGGTITVHSRAGQGATFVIDLPATA